MRAVRSGCLGSLFVVAVATLAGGPTVAHAQASASEQATGARRAPGQSTVPTSGPLVLEFDLPAEFRTQPVGSATAVTGFRVGFFQPNNVTAIRTVDFTRDALTVRDRTARLTLPRESIPEGIDNAVIRVQTLSRGQTSAWSDPVSLAGPTPRQAQATPQRPERSRVARTERPRSAAPVQRRTGLVPGDIEKYASLSESLRKLLPADAKIETELGRFRGIDELALAVVISREYDIPFTTLSQTLAGPPRVSPRNALTKLRRDLDVRDAIRKSRAEVRRLIGTPEGRTAQP
ncbi:MAG TPA: hypothetical protein VJA26_08430 [Gammaproteobacteria bacterium]|nr:hypothetical protein [Gammaproteobacteria bacterium]